MHLFQHLAQHTATCLVVAIFAGCVTAPGLAQNGNRKPYVDDTGRSPILTATDRFTKAQPFPSHLGDPPPADGSAVIWSDAPRHKNYEVTIVGTVLSTDQSQAGYPQFLRFKDAPRNKQPFEIVLFAGADADIPSGEPATSYYLSRTIKLTHTITTYRGNPQMAIEEPGVIEVVDPADYAHLGIQAGTKPMGASLAAIPWDQAKNHIGETARVTGRIVATYKSEGDPNRDDDGAIFFNFDKNYRGKFHLIMFPSAYGRFPGPPEVMFRNKNIAVTGKITEHRGTPQIEVTNPSQIRVIR